MSEYRPDAWVILRIEDTYKILGGWIGGFAEGDVWRLNSGISHIDLDGDIYSVYGYTGSVYYVHKDCQRMTMLMSSMYNYWKENSVLNIEIVDIEECMGDL